MVTSWHKEIPGARRLVCPTCEAVASCPLRAVVRYSHEGWPRCCGEVMVLVTDATAPDPFPVRNEYAVPSEVAVHS